jgi:ABC-type transport system involved in multi-copper enzyme maturation permease subunit
LGNGLLAQDPLVAMREGLDDLGRIVIAGVLIAFYLGAIGLTISSFTGRKSVAVGVIILGFVLTESLAFAISEALSENPEMGRWAFVISPANTIASLVDGLFGLPELDNTLPLPAAIAVMIGVIVVCCLIMFLSYQRRD